VLGSVAARQLFPYQDPLYQTIQVGQSGRAVVMLTVIGVLEPTGLRAGADSAGIMLRDIDQDIYFPLSLAHRTFGDVVIRMQAGSQERKQVELTEIWLQAEDRDQVERIASVAANVLSHAHPKMQDVDVKAPIQILRNAERLNRMFNFIMVGIASFSLVVGGIGIMNIMLATVTERTREIGIRRAIGAKRRDIVWQFLAETTVLSVAGGLAGILGGLSCPLVIGWARALFAQAAPKMMANLPEVVRDMRPEVLPESIVIAFIISVMIGIVFGLYPAVRAAHMDPIEALRHE
jgi:putative ABC transport system permease protein